MSKLVLNVKYLLCTVIFYNCRQVLQFGAHSRYYKGVLKFMFSKKAKKTDEIFKVDLTLTMYITSNRR